MNRIIEKEYFSAAVVKLVVEAPHIAKSRQAGHFVIVRVGVKGERIPLTIAEADVEKGTITLIVQKVGVTSIKLCNLEAGEYITDVVGPLGEPTHIEKVGTEFARISTMLLGTPNSSRLNAATLKKVSSRVTKQVSGTGIPARPSP